MRERCGVDDAHAIDRRAVAAAHVFHEKAAAVAKHAGVLPRDHVRINLNVALGMPADHRFVPRQFVSRRLAGFEDHDTGHGAFLPIWSQKSDSKADARRVQPLDAAAFALSAPARCFGGRGTARIFPARPFSVVRVFRG
jgi:hypothetical protein